MSVVLKQDDNQNSTDDTVDFTMECKVKAKLLFF